MEVTAGRRMLEDGERTWADADERHLLEESLEAACLGSSAGKGFAWLRGPDRAVVFGAVGLDPLTTLALRGIVASAVLGEISEAIIFRIDAAASLVLSLPLAEGRKGAFVLGGDQPFDARQERLARAVADRTAASLDARRAGRIAQAGARRASAETKAAARQAVIVRVVEAVRLHLDMDVGILGQFREGEEVFRYVQGDLSSFFRDRGRLALAESYGLRATQGTLPAAIPDTGAEPRAELLAITGDADIGSYVGVPVSLPDGSLFGALWCVSHDARPALGERDAAFLRVVAELLGEQLALEPDASLAQRRAVIERILLDGQPSMVFQPVCRTEDRAVLGVEALARFPGPPVQPPNVWFAEAATVGLGVELELAAARNALAALPALPAEGFLAVNLSPTAALQLGVEGVLSQVDPARLVIELTEHAPVTDYPALAGALAPLRAKGMRLAVDDAGAGYASFSHVLRLLPDLVKLDVALTRGIDVDPRRRALTAALLRFAEELGAEVVAEGVETEEELQTLRHLGVGAVQGFHLGRPLPLPVG